MNLNPVGLRAMRRGLKSHTLLDSVARHFTVGPFPKGRDGKFLKDDQSAKVVQHYLEEKYVAARITKRKGRNEPMQIVRNFWK